MFELSYDIKHKPGMFFIRLNPGRNSYLKYIVEGGQMKVVSTFTPEEFRGKGLAAALMETALNYAENHKLEVVPECSYAQDYLSKKRK